MSVKVEMMVQVCVNGRPIWRKAKGMRNELSFMMSDAEYAKVVDAAIAEHSAQVRDAVARAEAKEKAAKAKLKEASVK